MNFRKFNWAAISLLMAAATFWVLLPLELFADASDGQAASVTEIERDLPQLADIISQDDDIWTWLNDHLRNLNDLPAFWAPSVNGLPKHYLASHFFTKNGNAVITVAGKNPDGSPIEGEQVLANLVFEILNAAHRDDFRALDNLARQGRIDRQSFVDGMARIEQSSSLSLKKFRVDFWMPHAVRRGIPWDHDYWKEGASEDFDMYLRTVRAMHSGYPEDIYGPRYDREVGTAIKSLDSHPKSANNADTYTSQAESFYGRGDYLNALQSYQLAIQCDPNDANIYIAKANVQNALSKYDDAIRDAGNAIKLNPELPGAYNERARAELEEQNLKGALADCTEALRIAPTNSTALLYASYADEYLADWKGELSILQRYLVCNPSDADYTSLSIWCLEARIGNRKEADQILSAYLNQRSAAGDWVFSLGMFLTGRITEEQLLQEGSALEGDKVKEKQCEMFYYIGIKHLVSKDPKGAQTFFEKCVATEMKSYKEYQNAFYELKRLQ
jgi:tetratricopeptide (TPR) repeat protein